jgi:hypothetical protein
MNFCPIYAFSQVIKLQKEYHIWKHSLPIFTFSSGKLLTKSNFNKKLRILLKNSNGNHKKISGRSFRSGIPSLIEKNPNLLDDQHIKCWGRWRSNSYQRYMKKDKEQKKWTLKKICSILTPYFSGRSEHPDPQEEQDC